MVGKNLTPSLITYSITAERNKIENKMDDDSLANAVRLAVNVYDPLCEHYGKRIPFNSWFRSAELNKFLKGASTSQHCKGQAVDLDMPDNKELFNYIKDNLPFDQLIAEFPNKDGNPKWVHVSYTDNNRGQILRSDRVNGRVIYSQIAKL